jgi:2,4-dienoyl-CoA reductase-like NADH-dependent reductase (Old Yellow Enzyme family)
MSNLFSETTIRNLRIKNRIVMPPMVCFGWAGEEGLVTENNVKHYEARAKGGVGLIIVEATCVSRNGRLADRQLGLWSDVQIDGFSQIARACHQYGTRVLVQIHHAGLATPLSVSNDRVAPSEYKGQSNIRELNLSARVLTLKEIKAIQADFIAAAVRAKKAGLDGIELHGAHGYLISQFFSPFVNRREDSYGGDLEGRTRFATELIAGIRNVTGEDFIIGCRLGSNEPDLQTGIKIAQELEKSEVDILHISTGMATIIKTDSTESQSVPPDFKYNWIVYGGTQIKRNVKVPVIVVNGIRTPEQANYLIEHNLADFVALGKGLLVDPEWANKAQRKQNVTTCIDCKACSYFRPGALCPQQEPKSKKAVS